MKILFSIVMTVFLYIPYSYAITCGVYEVSGGTGNYNSTTNWSSSSGGSSGASLPTSSSEVCLDTHSGNLTINAASAAKDFLADGSGTGATGSYSGTLTFTSGQALTVSGNISIPNGVTFSGTGEITDGAAGTWTIVPSFTGQILLAGAVIVTLGAELQGAKIQLGNFTLSDASLYGINAQNLIINGAPVIQSLDTIAATNSLYAVNNAASIGAAFTLVKAATGSSSFLLNYTGPCNQAIITGYNFTDVNANGSTCTLWAMGNTINNSTLTRTNNIVNQTSASINMGGIE